MDLQNDVPIFTPFKIKMMGLEKSSQALEFREKMLPFQENGWWKICGLMDFLLVVRNGQQPYS